MKNLLGPSLVGIGLGLAIFSLIVLYYKYQPDLIGYLSTIKLPSSESIRPKAESIKKDLKSLGEGIKSIFPQKEIKSMNLQYAKNKIYCKRHDNCEMVENKCLCVEPV